MAKQGGEVNGKRRVAALWAIMAKDDPERDRRLAEALRQNLRRRKAQARAAEDVPADVLPGAPAKAGAQES